MKRQIEFRGLTAEGVWKYGWLIKHGPYYAIQNDHGGNDLVREDTIGQFIGIVDETGAKIYEDDIVLFMNGKTIGLESGIESDETMELGTIYISVCDIKLAHVIIPILID